MYELIYCATPSRLSNAVKEHMDFVSGEHNAPLHPFQAFPYERFEGGTIGRYKSMEFCRRAIRICDRVYLFGISAGALDDLLEGKMQNKPLASLVQKFDPEWRKYYELFIDKQKYHRIIMEVVGKK